MCDQIEAAMKQSKQASQSTEEEEEKVVATARVMKHMATALQQKECGRGQLADGALGGTACFFRASGDVMRLLRGEVTTEELRALGESLKSGFDARSLLEETREYLEEELACVGFLEARVRKNKKEADELASALGATLQRAGQEEKLQQLSVLRRAVANDVEATAALRRFAQEVEALCSAMLTKELVEKLKKDLAAIRAELETLKAKTPQAIWEEDLDAFVEELFEVAKTREGEE